MRNAIRILVLVLIAAGVYAYYQIPSASDKELNDALAQLSSDSTNTPQAAARSPGAAVPPPPHLVPSPPAQPKPIATASAAPPAAIPAPPPIKAWAPPDVMPAQPNWTWTTTDGTTYNNVVVTKIGPDTVSFTHAMGVAHDVPIANLPPDIQKKLNYDPVAAAAAHKEAKRERDHPYYAFADLTEAQIVARQLHWPLAWLCTHLADMSVANPTPGSEEDLSQRAVTHFKSRAIIVLVNGDELFKVPPLILNQFFVLDDGPIPGGHHMYAPKIVISDADITKTYGRISHTQMIARGDAAFDEGGAISTGATSPSSAITPSNRAPAPVASAAAAPRATTASLPSAPPATHPPPAPDQVIPWAPPDPIPAQPNWTWTTLDGSTYQNVVITKIEPETVSITHSLGVAHIPINLLPRDIQKQLNYHRP